MMNNVSLVGRLTADPEPKTIANGKSALNFCLAVQRDFKNANGEYDTDFINCSAFGSTAYFVTKYFKKGSFMAICGRLQIRKYTAKDGANRIAAEVIVNNVTYVGASEKKQDNTSGNVPQGFTEANDEEDLPF